MKEKYIKYKYDFNDYILLIKNGNFYICLNKDALVLSNIFGYKIIESKNFVKSGFPISSLEKIINKLIELNVNYLVIDKGIICKEKFENNKYNEYINNGEYLININRINKIYDILKSNVKNENINDILLEVEKIVCMINF